MTAVWAISCDNATCTRGYVGTKHRSYRPLANVAADSHERGWMSVLGASGQWRNYCPEHFPEDD